MVFIVRKETTIEFHLYNRPSFLRLPVGVRDPPFAFIWRRITPFESSVLAWPRENIFSEKYIYASTALVDLGHFFIFLILCTVGRTPCPEDQPVGRSPPTHRTAQIRIKRTKTSMSQVTFEPTAPVFERAKTVHALNRSATVIGRWRIWGKEREILKQS
jgi:hypothetical protein